MEKNEIMLAQDNLLTQAKYNFTTIEKRVLYVIINEVRRQFVESPNGQRNLFNDLIIKIKTDSLKDASDTLKVVYVSVKKLKEKFITIDNDKHFLCIGYMNYFKHEKGSDSVEIEVSKELLPYLVELAEQFTTYSLKVALSLKTKYSQRFYEFCSQFKSTGFMVMSIEDLRKKLILEEKYPLYGLLKKYVLEPSRKELHTLYEKGESDLYFTYKEDKLGRAVHNLIFKIIVKDDGKPKLSKPEDFIFHITKWLNSWLYASKRPKNKAWITKVVRHLNLHPEKIEPLYKRLSKIVQEESSKNHAALARYIIEEDFLSDENI